MTVGLSIPPGYWTPQRDFIPEVSTTASGNIIVVVGREFDEAGWQKTGHIVLTPKEARQLGAKLTKLAGEG